MNNCCYHIIFCILCCYVDGWRAQPSGPVSWWREWGGHTAVHTVPAFVALQVAQWQDQYTSLQILWNKQLHCCTKSCTDSICCTMCQSNHMMWGDLLRRSHFDRTHCLSTGWCSCIRLVAHRETPQHHHTCSHSRGSSMALFLHRHPLHPNYTTLCSLHSHIHCRCPVLSNPPVRPCQLSQMKFQVFDFVLLFPLIICKLIVSLRQEIWLVSFALYL